MAQAAGCGDKLVRDIESGRVDPTLDTVGRLVSSVGLEVRAGPAGEPNSRYLAVDPREVARVRAAFEQACEFAAQFGMGPPGPSAGTQPEWDGADPAPAHRFGAGPTRRDGGGWSAILVRCERTRINMSQGGLARFLGLGESDISLIEAGAAKLPVRALQAVLAAMGASLAARLEVYDSHDDGLHLRALADPERYRKRMRNAEAVFSNAVVLD